MNNKLILDAVTDSGNPVLGLNPIQKSFIEDFDNYVKKNVIDGILEVPDALFLIWVIYWFRRQGMYNIIEINSDIFSNYIVLGKIYGGVEVRVGVKENLILYKELSFLSYDELNLEYKKLEKELDELEMAFPLALISIYSSEISSEEERSLPKYIESHFVEQLENPWLSCEIDNIYPEDFNDRVLFSKPDIEFSIYYTNSGEVTMKRNLFASLKGQNEIVKLINFSFEESWMQEISNKWVRGKVMSFYIEEVRDVSFEKLTYMKAKCTCYWVYNWVYDLVITPNLDIYNAFISGRWPERDFRRFAKETFDLEKESIEDLKISIYEVLNSPHWIDEMTYEDIKKIVR